MRPDRANRFRVLYTVALETWVSSVFTNSSTCSAERCCGRANKTWPITKRCVVGVIPLACSLVTTSCLPSKSAYWCMGAIIVQVFIRSLHICGGCIRRRIEDGRASQHQV